MAKHQKRFRVVDRSFGTTSKRDDETGEFKGRREVRGPGDRTAIIRSKKSGQILGRTKAVKFRGSRGKRGGVRKK